jgi:RNA polymerase sigma factor (sigma-70 family)
MTTQTNNQTIKTCCAPECCQPEALTAEAPIIQAPITQDEIRSAVREHYDKLAQSNSNCCGPVGCNSVNPDISLALGYSADELAAAPEGANLGLGCGNPQAIAALQSGEVVLDLGSGAGFDCFLAARQVGVNGKVIGVDMTPAMLSKARENTQKLKANNVEFRLGEIEHPLIEQEVPEDETPTEEEDREASRELASCMTLFVVGLPSPYREAITLTELEGLTQREAAEMIGISLAAMKSRVLRGRAKLRENLEACCAIAVDARGKVISYEPRPELLTNCCPTPLTQISKPR